jgi:tetratricopeptide (TPR) repeat protein
LASQSVPPDRLYGVAHSYPINLAAESGLLGLVGLAWLTGVLIRHLGRARGSLLLEAHPLKAGAVAALVGCAVHSQFDSVEIVPSISLLLAMVVAMLLAPDEPRRTVPHVDAWILPLAWALLLATGVWSLHATLPFRQALSAADGGRWEDAASLLDEAARRDPGFGHYRIQAGYAHGMLVHEGDRDHLEEAIAHYRAGLDRFPSYALDAAHLAILYREAGDWDQALTWMERAVDLAPRSPLFTLNLGHLHEQLDHVNLAEQWYVTTLEERPELASAAFWRSSPIRTGTAERWLKDEGPSESMGAPRPPERWLAAGHSALSLGQYRQALSAFKRASDLKPGWVAAQLGQAEAYAGLGEYREAERMLRAARLTGGATRSHVRVSVALARLYYERGDDTKAIKTLESAIEAARRSTMHGEIFRWPRRAWLLFARRDLGTYLLPQLTVITITDEVADWMLELGGWYEETGDTTGAIRVYRELLEEVPDCDAARERLVQLEDPAQD